jgi:C-terminal processing protease CtpA/Prc
MRRVVLAAVLLATSVAAPTAQDALTTNQRDTDLVQLASMFAKNYAPYEWKRDIIGFDLYRLTPWLQRVHHADDLDFQEALIDYVASLNDAHASIFFPSNFSASLPFTVDIYDGRVLIDSVNRELLPAAQYPFDVGDELLALDGQSVQTLIASFGKYATFANPRATARGAASVITGRAQQFVPHAPELADSAVASIRLASAGAVNTYIIPWLKSGIGIASLGPVPSPRRGNGRIFLPSTQDSHATAVFGGTGLASMRLGDLRIADNTLPSYLDPIRPLLNVTVPKAPYAILGFGARAPVYDLPEGFVVRLGTQASHFFFSGTYVSNGVRIGFIRIPTMAPPNATLALQQLDQEIEFFNSSTDVLVVDIMRNPGGTVGVVEAFARRLFPQPFQTVGFEIRATATWLTAIVSAIDNAQRQGAPTEVVQGLRVIMNEILTAYNENRGRTAPVPLSNYELTLPPAPNAYTRPLLLLVDELTASGGDMLAAIIQDNHRGPLFGMRTMGAGGSVNAFDCTVFTESACLITLSLMNRGTTVSNTEFPPSPYIENVGVRPDIVVDYMTKANLLSAGAPFVQAFTDSAEKLAQASAVPH